MRGRRQKDPVHRIFFLCSGRTTDKAWSDFFKDCAHNKFPKGVRFENGSIKCTRKKNSFVEYIPKDTNKALNVILEIFRDRLGIKTTNEKAKEKVSFEKAREKLNIGNWSSIKSAGIRNMLITGYVDRFSEYNYLSQQESTELKLLINLGVSTKLLTSKNIILENGSISNIIGLNFNYNTRKFTISGVVSQKELTSSSMSVFHKDLNQVNGENFGSLLDYYMAKG